MDNLMLIRAFIFLAAGLISIIFRKQLNNIKNKFLNKLNIKHKEDERNVYFYFGIIFIIISIALFMYSIMN